MTIRSVGIIGAGFAGLSTAKVLRAFGFEVTVFEKEPDVGGVWAASRRYPGLTTQNPRTTYALSDFPMPAHYPEWPSGQQVQAYLHAYAEHFGLIPHLRMSTTVESAVQDEEAGVWTVKARRATAGLPAEAHRFDYLVVCNGIFSEPAVPQYPGADAFEAAGGRVCHTSQFNDANEARGKHVLVVGYGKSSCDVANAIAMRTHFRGGQHEHVDQIELILRRPKQTFVHGLVAALLFLGLGLGGNLFLGGWLGHQRGLAGFLSDDAGLIADLAKRIAHGFFRRVAVAVHD